MKNKSRPAKTILVTGAAGFIGSNLCSCLLSDKRNLVIGLDNFLSGNPKNIDFLRQNVNFRFYEQDIRFPISIEDRIDEVYNLACPASPVDFLRFPLEILETCSIGVKNGLEFALKNKASYLHSSTSEVYGDPKEHPQKETYWGHTNPIGSRSCYDEGKRFAESMIMNYFRIKKLNIKIARIFNTYGPRMRKDDGRVVSNFINQALESNNLTIYGRGKQTRSFCFVSDLVAGLIALMKSKETGPINIGNPKEFTIKELAQKVLKITHSQVKINYLPLPQDDPKQRCPDISLAIEKLRWQPKVNLEEGLERTISYFKEL